ncbi:MAG: hypothetical protein KBD50_00155 [Candidatus Pacebacteria bacterium]|nr:hypothetical protein [Candidatus Paceibacterota bacterium]
MYQVSFRLLALIVTIVAVATTTALAPLVQTALYALIGLKPVSATATWSDVSFALEMMIPSLFVVLLFVRLLHKGLVKSLQSMAFAVGNVTGIAALILCLFRPHNYPDVFNSSLALLLLESSDVQAQFLIFGLMMFAEGFVGGAVYFYCSAMPVERQ